MKTFNLSGNLTKVLFPVGKPSEEQDFFIYEVQTSQQLPGFRCISGIYEKNPIYKGSLKYSGVSLMLDILYHFEVRYETRREGNVMQHSHTITNWSTPINKEVQQYKFLSDIAGRQRADSILEHCPKFIDKVLSGEKIELKTIPYLKEKSFKLIETRLRERYPIYELSSWLSPFKIKIQTMQKLLQLEKNPRILRQKIEENPYIISHMKGTSFVYVDKLALKINPANAQSLHRLESFIEHYLNRWAQEEGDTMIPIEQLKEEVHKKVPECEDMFNELKVTIL